MFLKSEVTKHLLCIESSYAKTISVSSQKLQYAYLSQVILSANPSFIEPDALKTLFVWRQLAHKTCFFIESDALTTLLLASHLTHKPYSYRVRCFENHIFSESSYAKQTYLDRVMNGLFGEQLEAGYILVIFHG